MTAEQLRRLSEIACVELDQDDHSDNYILWDKFGTSYVQWVPHIAIEQAMMEAEAFEQWTVTKYLGYECILTIDDCELIGRGSTPALAICRAALAAKEG